MMGDYWYWLAIAWLYVAGCSAYSMAFDLALPYFEPELKRLVSVKWLRAFIVLSWPLSVPWVVISTPKLERG